MTRPYKWKIERFWPIKIYIFEKWAKIYKTENAKNLKKIFSSLHIKMNPLIKFYKRMWKYWYSIPKRVEIFYLFIHVIAANLLHLYKIYKNVASVSVEWGSCSVRWQEEIWTMSCKLMFLLFHVNAVEGLTFDVFLRVKVNKRNKIRSFFVTVWMDKKLLTIISY